MQVVVKLYENQWSTVPYSQDIIVDEVVISKDLFSFDEAKLQVPNINGLLEDNKIEIYETTNSRDELIFSGFIYEIIPIRKQFGRINIVARSEKAILGKRLMLTNAKFYDADRKLSAVPAYPSSWSEGEAILTGTAIYTNTGVFIPDDGGSITYTYTSQGLSDLSYVYVKATGDLWKYDGSLTNLGTQNGLPVKDYIEEMLDDYNNSYGDNRTVEVGINTNLRTNRNLGDNIFDIIDDIAQEANCSWDVQGGVIKFSELIGKDRTFGTNYQEILFDGQNPQVSNIETISLVGQATSVSILLYKGQRSGYTKDDSNYVSFTKGVQAKEFRDGNLTNKVSNYLDVAKNPQRTYQVQVEQNSIVADVGDKIKFIVENTNDYFNIDTDVLVTNKTITYNKGKNETFGVQEFKIQQVTNQNRAKTINQKLNMLNIQQTLFNN